MADSAGAPSGQEGGNQQLGKTPGDGGDFPSAMLSLSALECGVCLSLVCQPISLSCGHSFCRSCLVSTLRRNKKKCPTCRAVCHNSAEDQPEDVMIANIARTCFPEMTERRLREVETDRNTWMSVLPIFYYNMPMFPGEVLNLHLFEPRYKIMIQRIVSTSRRFAYVPNYTDYNASIGDVALIADVRDCEFLSDGRVLLVAKLTLRQTVQDHFVEEGTQGLHYCRLEARVDEPPADSGAAAELGALYTRTRLLTERVIEPIRAQVVDRYGNMPEGAEAFSLWIASVLPMAVREKHALLAGDSTSARLLACEGHLASLDGNAPAVPPSRVPAAAVAEAYERHLASGESGDEAGAVAQGAALADEGGGALGGEQGGAGGIAGAGAAPGGALGVGAHAGVGGGGEGGRGSSPEDRSGNEGQQEGAGGAGGAMSYDAVGDGREGHSGEEKGGHGDRAVERAGGAEAGGGGGSGVLP